MITQQDWDDYELKVKVHKKFIENYRFFLDRIVNHLKWKQGGQKESWTPDEIHKVMTSEIDMAASMDAPNKPGYYRANND